MVGWGAYAIVNVPSGRSTHFETYCCLSDPTGCGEPQKALGLLSSSSFLIQVKNSLAPAPEDQREGLSPHNRVKYPD